MPLYSLGKKEAKKKMRNDLHNTIKMCIKLRLRTDHIKSFLQTLIRIICAFIVIVDPHSLKHMHSSSQKAFSFSLPTRELCLCSWEIFHGRKKRHNERQNFPSDMKILLYGACQYMKLPHQYTLTKCGKISVFPIPTIFTFNI